MTERDWLLAERPEYELTPEATERAERELLAHVKPRRRRGVAPALVLAAAALAAAVVWATHTPAPAKRAPAAAAVRRPPSLALVAYKIRQAPRPEGDATLVIRHTMDPGNGTIDGYDLYTDDGRYFFAHTKGGLPAEIKANHTQGDGIFAREIVAAKEAADGDVADAAQKMIDAPFAHPPKRDKPLTQELRDNWLWGGAYDVLNAGAGQPEVRAGVLKLIATIQGVTVKAGADNTLTLSNGDETIVIDATDGTPKVFYGGNPAKPTAKITYDISRVKLADIAA